MRVHFIAIGGSAMHNLAIALNRKGYKVTGSDDEIFEPSRGRLLKEGILPKSIGWYPENIDKSIEAVILGMHARADNPELLKAKLLNIPIYSYPEYLFEQSKNKKRIVIGGSHGKTTITAMLLHALNKLDSPVDFMVGAQLDGYDCMVNLTDENDVIILEGDEYLSSPIDRRPKFHLYNPHVALISGISWDHINVFPTLEDYHLQFKIFIDKIEKHGSLIYNSEDKVVNKLGQERASDIKCLPYQTPNYKVKNNGSSVEYKGKWYDLKVFGAHNVQNIFGALLVAQEIGIDGHAFLRAMADFKGAGKRLELVYKSEKNIIYKDFAHSPSKLKATTDAVKQQFNSYKVFACMELHTFSSLNKDFLPLYNNTIQSADHKLVYFNPKVVEHKKLPMITKQDVERAFGVDINVFTDKDDLLAYIQANLQNSNNLLLMMSSGNFDGIDYNALPDRFNW